MNLPGVRGGSLWILLVNFAVFKAYGIYRTKGAGAAVPLGLGIVFLLLVPVFLSFHIFGQFKPGGEPVKVALVQPNLDPYAEKFVPEKQAGAYGGILQYGGDPL